MKIMITGQTGFIGKRLSKVLEAQGRELLFVSRGKNYMSTETIVCDLEKDDLPINAFKNVDIVFHLAANSMNGVASDPDEESYEKINVRSTIKIAKKAEKMNVKKFIFLSSVKAGSPNIESLKEYLLSSPQGRYGRSKKDAENKLISLSKNSEMDIIIIRSALVYGHNHKGNLKKLSAVIKKFWFFPLPDVRNKRSMIHLDDLIRAMILLMDKKKIDQEIYVLTDQQFYSSRRIYEAFCRYHKKRLPRWSIPFIIFRVIGKINTKLQNTMNKLFEDEFYVSSESKNFDFRPKYTLENMGQYYFD